MVERGTRLTVRRLLALLLIVPLAFTALVATAAPSDAAVTKWRMKSSGNVVSAFSQSEDGCLITFSSIFANESSVDYFAGSFDRCTNQEISAAQGVAAPDVFDVRRDLSSARVTAVIPVVDQITGEASEIVVDNTWVATGPVVHRRSTYVERVPGVYRLVSKFRGKDVTAAVSGTVPFDEGSIGKYTVIETRVERS